MTIEKDSDWETYFLTLTFFYLLWLNVLQIVWPWNVNTGWDASVDRNFIASVDGTHCRINEPHGVPSAKYYSHKFHKPGLGYEIAIDVFDGNVIWVNGPFPAGMPDITIFRQPEGLKSNIPANKLIIADLGYRGEDDMICLPNDLDTAMVKKFKKRVRARHESFNSRIKEFKTITERFRHDINKHKAVFEAVCILVQYDIETGRTLFK